MERDQTLALDRSDRAVCGLHAPSDLARDPVGRARLQDGRSDGRFDGGAPLHLAGLLARRDRRCFQAGRILRDCGRSAHRRVGDGAVRHPAFPDPVRRVAVGGQFVLCTASCKRPPARLSGALRHSGKRDRCNGGSGVGDLSLEFVLAGLHCNSIRATLFARIGWAYAGSFFERSACREAWLGAVLLDHHCGDGSGAVAACLDRSAGGCTIQPEVALACPKRRASCARAGKPL